MWREFLASGQALVKTYRRHWLQLAAVDLASKAAGFIVLAPAAGLLARALLALSGNALLADQDIVAFLAGPVGWVFLLVIVSANLAVLAVGLSAALIYLEAADHVAGFRWPDALTFSLRRLGRIFDLAWRVVLRLGALVVPFLGAGLLVGWILLSEHDINFYLVHRPPELLIAVAVVSGLGAGYLALAAALIARWFFALPLILLEEYPPRQAMAESARRSQGHRAAVFVFILIVVLALAVFSAASSVLGAWATAWVLGSVQRTPALFVAILGFAFLGWSLWHVVLGVLGDTIFAAAVAVVYRRHGRFGTRPSLLESFHPAGHSRRLRVPRFAQGLAILLAVPLAGATGWYLLAQVPVEESVVVLAHRAGATAAAENTLAAIEKAIQLGADYVEIDVQQTADGHVVLAHDRDLMRVAGVPVVIEEATLEELKSVDVGRFFGPQCAGQRVPELADALSACRGRIGMAIELKHYGQANRLEESVIECVERFGMAEEVLLLSLDRGTVRKLKRLRPSWRVGQLTAVAVGDLARDEVDVLAVHSSLATLALVKRAHGRGQQLFAWTINDPVLLSVMASRGVDGVITDDVQMAREVLRQRAEMTPLERLMLEAAIVLGRQPTVLAPRANSN
ncbi:MAG TPA: hypothetical protein EYP56_03935 [Planctomycetaceae bacterium]|nr:hypothetical protein [Planctomycetaceae bacterium]